MTPNLKTIHRRITIQSLLSSLLVIFGMIITLLALYLPPVGEIHPSVITVFGIALTVAGAFIGIDLSLHLKYLTHLLEEAQKTKKDESEA